MVFRNRTEAGAMLAEALAEYKGRPVVVFALPRGGVPIGAQVAKFLHAPLGLIIPRKIGHPCEPEYAIGAVTETGRPVWNETERARATEGWRERQVSQAREEAHRRRAQYQGDQPQVEVSGKIAIVVDDGIATGLTMTAALEELHQRRPSEMIVAVPVAPEEAGYELLKYTDKVIVLYTPEYLGAIGAYYQEFEQVSDEKVKELLLACPPASPSGPLDLSALNNLVATIHDYPVSSQKMVNESKRLHSPANVVSFFEAIPSGTEFRSKADIMQRTKYVEVVREEQPKQPQEDGRDHDS